MSENTSSIEEREKQLRVLQRKLERSEWHRVDLEKQHDRDQHLYRRVQTDLEAAKREAEVEAALERIRAQSMGMQHSSELVATSAVFHEQLLALGVPSELSYVWLPDEAAGKHQFWAAWTSEEDGEPVHRSRAVTYDLDREEPYTAACFAAWASDTRMLVDFIPPGDVERFFATWEELLRGAEHLSAERFSDGLYYAEGYMQYGCFGINIRREPTQAERGVLRRVAVEFERAYTRYLDLQQSEARLREAQIEAAMERVRSRALAMTTSDELLDVVFAIRKQFAGLGLECGAFWHTRYTPECYQKALTSVDGQKLAAVMELPRDFSSNPELAAWEQGDEPIGVFPFNAEAGSQYLSHMVAKGRFTEVDPEAITEAMVREHGGLTFVQARTSHGEIGYSLWGEAEPSDEAKDVLVRFAGAFDLAYRRFEDLQQAEADHRALLEEKALTDQALAHLRATQAQLVQSEKMASLGALTAGIAHEIKNPLNFVNNFAGLSREIVAELEGEADPELRSALLADLKTNAAKIEEHGRRADAIVRSMMEHARSGSGERRAVTLNALVEEYAAHALHAAKVRHRGFAPALALDLASDAGAVEVAPQEIGRVLVNLIDNALDATRRHAVEAPDGYVPTVTVSTRRLSRGAEVRVVDNGPGMVQGVREKVFEPFFTTKPAGEGTGLGLSMSYDIVTQGHGGTLTVESEPGEGAEFTLTLPASSSVRAARNGA